MNDESHLLETIRSVLLAYKELKYRWWHTDAWKKFVDNAKASIDTLRTEVHKDDTSSDSALVLIRDYRQVVQQQRANFEWWGTNYNIIMGEMQQFFMLSAYAVAKVVSGDYRTIKNWRTNGPRELLTLVNKNKALQRSKETYDALPSNEELDKKEHSSTVYEFNTKIEVGTITRQLEQIINIFVQATYIRDKASTVLHQLVDEMMRTIHSKIETLGKQIIKAKKNQNDLMAKNKQYNSLQSKYDELKSNLSDLRQKQESLSNLYSALSSIASTVLFAPKGRRLSAEEINRRIGELEIDEKYACLFPQEHVTCTMPEEQCDMTEEQAAAPQANQYLKVAAVTGLFHAQERNSLQGKLVSVARALEEKSFKSATMKKIINEHNEYITTYEQYIATKEQQADGDDAAIVENQTSETANCTINTDATVEDLSTEEELQSFVEGTFVEVCVDDDETLPLLAEKQVPQDQRTSEKTEDIAVVSSSTSTSEIKQKMEQSKVPQDMQLVKTIIALMKQSMKRAELPDPCADAYEKFYNYLLSKLNNLLVEYNAYDSAIEKESKEQLNIQGLNSSCSKMSGQVEELNRQVTVNNKQAFSLLNALRQYAVDGTNQSGQLFWLGQIRSQIIPSTLPGENEIPSTESYSM